MPGAIEARAGAARSGSPAGPARDAAGGAAEEEGALDFDRTEVKPVLANGTVTELRTDGPNRARDMIENFMVAANGVTAKFLSAHGFPSIRRVVRSPERWPRIVDLAPQHGTTLPGAAGCARARGASSRARRAAAPGSFADLSLSVIKLLGPRRIRRRSARRPVVASISRSRSRTTPIRQRRIGGSRISSPSAWSRPPSTSDRRRTRCAELAALAEHCTKQEDAANKVERLVRKAAAALLDVEPDRRGVQCRGHRRLGEGHVGSHREAAGRRQAGTRARKGSTSATGSGFACSARIPNAASSTLAGWVGD